MKTSPLFSQKEIERRIDEIAGAVNLWRGAGEEVTAVGVLKGVFVFYSELVRRLKSDVICEFCAVSFYGGEITAQREPALSLDIQTHIRGKHVLLIDCIADRGLSLRFLSKRLQEREPKSLKTAALLIKPAARNIVDFKGFSIDQDVFAVGYGIDYKEKGRNLNHIAQVSNIN